MAHTSLETIENKSRTIVLNKNFSVTIKNDDQINMHYPCGITAPAVYVNTGHGVKHATWTLQDDFEKHCLTRGNNPKILCEKCCRRVLGLVKGSKGKSFKEMSKELGIPLTPADALEMLSAAMLASLGEIFKNSAKN